MSFIPDPDTPHGAIYAAVEHVQEDVTEIKADVKRQNGRMTAAESAIAGILATCSARGRTCPAGKGIVISTRGAVIVCSALTVIVAILSLAFPEIAREVIRAVGK